MDYFLNQKRRVKVRTDLRPEPTQETGLQSHRHAGASSCCSEQQDGYLPSASPLAHVPHRGMEETPGSLGSSSSTVWAVPGTPLQGTPCCLGRRCHFTELLLELGQLGSMGGSEEEGGLPGPHTAALESPAASVATAAPGGPVPALPRGGTTHTCCGMQQKLLLLYVRFVLTIY